MRILILLTCYIMIIVNGAVLTQCSCSQLQIESECNQNTLCNWIEKVKGCGGRFSGATVIEATPTPPKYCEQFTMKECPIIDGCAWNDECTHFTGCTAFNKQTPEDCQQISNKCTSDGVHCIDIDACTSYTTQIACASVIEKQNCFWDLQKSICVDVTQCEQLSSNLATDADCRKRLPFCTTSGSGCIVSGPNCSDQQNQDQCFWNVSMTQQCIWNSSCMDKICVNAPQSYTTESQCQSIDSQCTTKKLGGCIMKSTCEEADIKESCTTDSKNQTCFWNGTTCVPKICSNAPQSYQTNYECQQFISTCITNGNGCNINTICSSALVSQACDKNAQGEQCFWDQSCKEKTCANLSFNTHELCSSFLNICTINNVGNGCQNKTCDNAPVTLITNQECENYLPNNKCITKQGGGCRKNTLCSQINIEVACEQDSTGQSCFWDQEMCKEKTCLNAPLSYKTHNECKKFLSTCTIKQDGNGCIDKNCENIQDKSLCIFNLYKKPCLYKNNKCRVKECVLATQQYRSHDDCYNYLNTCTLSNTGAGCVQIPLTCEAITIQQACVIRQNNQAGIITQSYCGWNGISCVDKSCQTAPLQYTTTQQCQQYLDNCVSANPIIVNGNSIAQGCMSLPQICSERESFDNCQVKDSQCVWIYDKCIRKTCQTATLEGTSISAINYQSCNDYQNNCIPNNTDDGCMERPLNCSMLVQSNCQSQSLISSGCYWSLRNSNCVELTCSNIENATSHQSCNSILDTCTVNSILNGCQTLATNCSDYSL